MSKILIVEGNIHEDNQKLLDYGIETHSESLIKTISNYTKKLEIDVFNPSSEKLDNTINELEKYDGLIWGGGSMHVYDDKPEIKKQIETLVLNGIKEVVLTGVDITSWGLDFEKKERLGDLICFILNSIPSLERLRISSIDSIEIDPKLMDLLCTETRLMPHLHLSLQYFQFYCFIVLFQIIVKHW